MDNSTQKALLPLMKSDKNQSKFMGLTGRTPHPPTPLLSLFYNLVFHFTEASKNHFDHSSFLM
jgi:hypothetical protein